MKGILARIRNELPLEISFSSWDDVTLVMSGKNWSFSTQSAWRVFGENAIFLGCLDENSQSICEILKNVWVTEIDFQNFEIPVDFSFRLSDGRTLETFSTDTVEPWVINLPQLGVCVGNGEILSNLES